MQNISVICDKDNCFEIMCVHPYVCDVTNHSEYTSTVLADIVEDYA